MFGGGLPVTMTRHGFSAVAADSVPSSSSLVQSSPMQTTHILPACTVRGRFHFGWRPAASAHSSDRCSGIEIDRSLPGNIGCSGTTEWICSRK